MLKRTESIDPLLNATGGTMDAMDILGGLLGGKSGGGSIGGKILKEILTGGSGGGGGTSAGRAQPSPSQTQSQPGSRGRGSNIDAASKELEDLLNVANQRTSSRQTQSPTQSAPTSSNYQQPQRPQYKEPAPQFNPVPKQQPIPQAKPHSKPSIFPDATEVSQEERQNAMALVLIRAMIHASKADGDVSEEEQQKIFEQLGDTSQDAIRFLRTEFAQPSDVR